jgi:acyl-CoA thioesterase I
MNNIKYLLIFFGLYFLSFCSQKVIKIVCIGDSITEGYGLANQSKTAYPAVLDSILGMDYDVLNSGRSATTLQKEGNFPFWICKEFSNVFEYKPNIVTIMLGTNDTKPENWNAIRFETNYQALIDTLNTIKSKPQIYLVLPVPVYQTNWGINDSTVNAGIMPIIKKLAEKNKLKVIDLYHTMQNQPVNFPDGIHPNEKAEKMMAEIIANAIKK